MKKLKRAVILLAIAAVLYGCGAKAGSVSENMAAADAEYREMISGEAEGKDVCLVYTDDFENKGTYQAFAFAGDLTDDTNYEGKLWFIDKDKKQLVSGDALLENGLSENDLKFDLGGNKFLKMDYFPAETDIWTAVYGVKDGRPYKADISDLGSIDHRDDTADFTITAGSFDSMYEPDEDSYSGHTWKPYYFYYDGNEFHEYGGLEMTEEQLMKYDGGAKITADIKAAGLTVESIYYHANGIVTVNYSSGDDENGRIYGNAVLAIRDNKIMCVDPYTLQEKGSFSDTDLDGTYLKNLSELAVFPERIKPAVE